MVDAILCYPELLRHGKTQFAVKYLFTKIRETIWIITSSDSFLPREGTLIGQEVHQQVHGTG